jgi:PAS domain S-box-containing protein
LSIPTAIAFLAVAVGAASLHPETGVMSLLASPGAAGASARFLLPTGAFLPIVVGWIRIRAGALGFFGVESGTAFFATFTALGLVALSWRNARGLQRLDLVREEADARIHEELERTRAALELARGYLESAPGAMLVADADGLVAVANSEAERLFRTRRAALLGQRLDALLPEHLSDASYGRRTIARTAGPRSVEVETSFRPLATREGVLTIVGLRDITAQRRAEAELVASERRFRGIFDSTLHFIGLMSPDGTLLEVNRAALEFGGVSREEVIDKPLWEARPWTHDPEVQVRLRDAVRRAAAGELVSFETRVLGADDRLAIVAFSLKPLRDEDGEVVLLVPEAQDVTEARGAEERLRASLAEKETLLKEVHHRVKNNLQVISSLLKLHAGRVADPDARAAFEEAQGRVRSIALLHEKLYRSESLGSVSIGDYAEDLASALLRARGADGRPVRISVSGGDVHLPVDRAMPCGLILNELVTNSLKHGFPAAIAEPEVAIRARRVGCEIEITVTDNGVGLPEDFDPRGTRTLGIQLVRTLTRQLGGSIAFERHAGTRCVLQFPARDQTAEAS